MAARTSRRRSARREGDPFGATVALLGTRVSSDEQRREGLSLPTQLSACRRYCAGQDGWIIGGEYQDVLTGKRDDRPGYQAMLAEARRLVAAGRRVVVVVARLDRLGRRLMERVRCREELKELGVETHSVREGGLVSDLMANMLAVLAEEEVERLSGRIVEVREEAEANGWHMPGRPAWGYGWRPATDAERAAGAPKVVLEPNEAEAQHAAEMFRMVASGEATVRGAAVWTLSLPDEARGGRRLNYSSVQLLLASPVYAGRLEDGSRGNWEPLVDDATWDAVQARLGQGRGRSGPVSGCHLLTGLLECPACESGMAGWTMHGRWKRYRCNAFLRGDREKAGRGCNETAAAKSLDADVIRQVSAILAPVAHGDPIVLAAIGREWERIRKPNDGAAKERARLVARAERHAADARRRLADAARQLVDGVLSKAAYDALAAEEERRLDKAERELTTPELAPPTTVTLPPWQAVLDELGGWVEALAQDAIPAHRRVLARFVERVVPSRLSHGKYRAKITWTPLGDALGAVTERVA